MSKNPNALKITSSRMIHTSTIQNPDTFDWSTETVDDGRGTMYVLGQAQNGEMVKDWDFYTETERDQFIDANDIEVS